MSIPGLSFSALPGLALADPTSEPLSSAAPKVRTQTLHKETEYRFESSFVRPITIKLLTGTAELFGTELAPTVAYIFKGTKGAVYTWQGCELEITGAVDTDYIAEETPMSQYANTHFALEDLRSAADDYRDIGPRVMIVGPENAGKTSLAKILTSYAVKSRRQPVLVNLDPRQGLLSVPGSLTATTFSTLVDVEEGWGSSPISGPSAIPVKMPLCYHFGCQDPEENAKLFKPLVTRLALATTSRLEEDPEARSSGCIIDTPGTLSSGKSSGYELIQHIASEFSVTVLLVLGSERLYSELKRRLAASDTEEAISVIKLDKSGGCVDRDESYMRKLREAQIKEYFYGHGNLGLSPFTQLVEYNQVTVYRINDAAGFTSAFDPGADDDDEDEYEPRPLSTALYEKITPSLMLQNSIIAVTEADAHDSQNIRDSCVMWYVYVADVDESKQRLKLVNPVSGRIPPNALVWGSWPEGVADMVG